MNDNIYLEVEQHPSGWWFNVVHPHGTPEGEAIVLIMSGPYANAADVISYGDAALELELGLQKAAA